MKEKLPSHFILANIPKELVDAIIEGIRRHLLDNSQADVPNLGTFILKHSQADPKSKFIQFNANRLTAEALAKGLKPKLKVGIDNNFSIEISERLTKSKEESRAVLEMFVTALIGALQSTGEIDIAGLGKFGLFLQDKMEGQNPVTGKPIVIPAKAAIKFAAHPIFLSKLK